MSGKQRAKRCSPLEISKKYFYIDPEEGLEVRPINKNKGRGVFATKSFMPGDFICCYRGNLSSKKGLAELEKQYEKEHAGSFVFDFVHIGQKLCIDATVEDSSYGRIINDSKYFPNAMVKKVVDDDLIPHLAIFALKTILPDEEITYFYGEDGLPWHKEEKARYELLLELSSKTDTSSQSVSTQPFGLSKNKYKEDEDHEIFWKLLSNIDAEIQIFLKREDSKRFCSTFNEECKTEDKLALKCPVSSLTENKDFISSGESLAKIEKEEDEKDIKSSDTSSVKIEEKNGYLSPILFSSPEYEDDLSPELRDREDEEDTKPSSGTNSVKIEEKKDFGYLSPILSSSPEHGGDSFPDDRSVGDSSPIPCYQVKKEKNEEDASSSSKLFQLYNTPELFQSYDTPDLLQSEDMASEAANNEWDEVLQSELQPANGNGRRKEAKYIKQEVDDNDLSSSQSSSSQGSTVSEEILSDVFEENTKKVDANVIKKSNGPINEEESDEPITDEGSNEPMTEEDLSSDDEEEDEEEPVNKRRRDNFSSLSSSSEDDEEDKITRAATLSRDQLHNMMLRL